MNHPLCAVDQRPVHTAGNLCPACWVDLEHDLAELAESLLYDLERTLAGLTRTGGSPIGIVVRTAERGLGFDERAGDLLRQLHNTLGGWVRVIAEDNYLATMALVCSICHVEQRLHAEGPAPRERFWYLSNTPMDVRNDTADLARWLGEHEQEIRRHEAVGELWNEVHGLVETGRALIDRRRREDGLYLGVCSASADSLAVGVVQPEQLCANDLYEFEDRTTTRCRSCGAVHDVAERRAIMLAAMGGQKLTAAEITRAFAAYGGIEISLARIGMWAVRRKIYAHPPRPGEKARRYRVAAVRRILDRELTNQKAS